MHTPIVPTLVLALSVCLPAAAGGYEALSFTGFAAKTQITDQYASQGILLGFPSSAGNITQNDASKIVACGQPLNGAITLQTV